MASSSSDLESTGSSLSGSGTSVPGDAEAGGNVGDGGGFPWPGVTSAFSAALGQAMRGLGVASSAMRRSCLASPACRKCLADVSTCAGSISEVEGSAAGGETPGVVDERVIAEGGLAGSGGPGAWDAGGSGVLTGGGDPRRDSLAAAEYVLR